MINWKVRFHNKTFLVTLSGVILTFIYTLLSLFGITPSITQSTVTDVVLAVLNLLAAAGVILDPTTQGISDSQQAMNYQTPKEDVVDEGN